MYAQRRGWPLESLVVGLSFLRTDLSGRIERRLTPKGPLDRTQCEKLADVAERTPVTLVIKSGVTIDTYLESEG